jgi:hypothetical protein
MNEPGIRELRARLRGELITPRDAAYESARKVHYARPAQMKREYHRANLFRVNQNMKPA